MDGLVGHYASDNSSSSSSSSASASSSSSFSSQPRVPAGNGADAEDEDFKIVSITPGSPLISAQPETGVPFPAAPSFTTPIGPSPAPSSAQGFVPSQSPSLRPATASASFPDPGLKAWVEETLALRTKGIRFEDSLRDNPRFQNPALCSKMIAFNGLEEYGTDVDGLGGPVDEDGFYDVIAKRQQLVAEESGSVSKMMLQQQELEKRRHQEEAKAI